MSDIARRCSSCDTSWPNATSYHECPTCKIPTWEAKGDKPLSYSAATELLSDRAKDDEARRRRYDEFEQYYVEHCAKQLRDAIEAGLPAEA